VGEEGPGNHVFFGRVSLDPRGEAALQKWLDQKDDLLAGRVPRAKLPDLTVADLTNLWLDWKKARVASGELSPRTWEQYKSLAKIVLQTFGRDRLAADPGPDDSRSYGMCSRRAGGRAHWGWP
jgi:hypothetical protein